MDLSKLSGKYKSHEISGWDISLNSTGVAYYDQLDETYITSLIKPTTLKEGKFDHMDRLNYIRTSTEKFLQHMPHIRLAIIEDYAMAVGKSKLMGLTVREAGGIIKNVLHSGGVDLLLVSPTTLKLFATGSGAADRGDPNKTMMRRAANDNFGVVRKTTDEIDAFWLLQLGMYVAGCNVTDRSRAQKISNINGTVFYKHLNRNR